MGNYSTDFPAIILRSERQVSKILRTTSEFLYYKIIVKPEEHWCIQKLKSDAWNFQHFDYAWYAVGEALQQTFRQSGNMADGKKIFVR